MENSTNQQSKNQLGPRSLLLESFFDYISAEGVSYAVMNNYEELPWIIPSDVDFTVDVTLFRRLDKFIGKFAALNGYMVVQKLWHGNLKCAYILSVGSKGEQEFVQLDFFVAFSTKRCPALLSHEELMAGHRKFRNFRVPSPEVELIFIAMRRLFKNDWSERHCSRIAELRAKILSDDWLLPRYAWLEPTLTAAVQGKVNAVSARRANDWLHLRQNSRKNIGLRDWVMNLALQTKRIAVRLRDETGYLVGLSGLSSMIEGNELDSLELVFHRRLFLDEKVLNTMSVLTRLLLPMRLALLKRRKGLILLHVEPNDRLAGSLIWRLRKLGLLDHFFTNVYAKDQSAAAVLSPDDLIDEIVNRQASKTLQAMTRGWTQTNG